MDKLYYSINEIANLLNKATHTIRYWEQQFPFLKPQKTKTGAKLYTKEQFNRFKYIQKEIDENNMSVAGLKKKITNVKEINKNAKEINEGIVLTKTEFREMLSLFHLMFDLLYKEEELC